MSAGDLTHPFVQGIYTVDATSQSLGTSLGYQVNQYSIICVQVTLFYSGIAQKHKISNASNLDLPKCFL